MKFGEDQSAMRTVAARTVLLSAVAALTLGPLLPVFAAESDKDPATTSAIGPVKMRFLSLGIGKSVVVDLPRDVKDVLAADPPSARPTWCFSTAMASRSLPTTSQSSVISTASVPR